MKTVKAVLLLISYVGLRRMPLHIHTIERFNYQLDLAHCNDHHGTLIHSSTGATASWTDFEFWTMLVTRERA